ncbi:MAG TPA: helix-turn-helix domain-containing protein [Candidatus Eisenbacteria bacterium]|nr:helix-turn-helix domain-containing protein [Candidatus Eisenbacteria bacterium]
MPTPRPGRPVRGSRTGRPIMALLDLLGRRWALRILWELAREPGTFAALQARCDAMSPSVLNQRLAELRDAGIVAPGDAGYALTPEGVALARVLGALDAWAKGWAASAARPGSPPRRTPASRRPCKVRRS